MPTVEEMVSDSPTPRQRRNRSFIRGLGAGLLVGLVLGGMGGSYAANISLGSGNVEFGQGVVAANACDSNITVKPVAEYGQGNPGSYWIMTRVTLEDIDVAACQGKIFTLRFDAGVPGGLGLNYDPTPYPFVYTFPVDFVADDPADPSSPGNFLAGYTASKSTLMVDGQPVGSTIDNPQYGFVATSATEHVLPNATDGKIVIYTRALSETVTHFLLETSDQ